MFLFTLYSVYDSTIYIPSTTYTYMRMAVWEHFAVGWHNANKEHRITNGHIGGPKIICVLSTYTYSLDINIIYTTVNAVSWYNVIVYIHTYIIGEQYTPYIWMRANYYLETYIENKAATRTNIAERVLYRTIEFLSKFRNALFLTLSVRRGRGEVVLKDILQKKSL